MAQVARIYLAIVLLLSFASVGAAAPISSACAGSVPMMADGPACASLITPAADLSIAKKKGLEACGNRCRTHRDCGPPCGNCYLTGHNGVCAQ
jgi:hypothetical protein